MNATSFKTTVMRGGQRANWLMPLMLALALLCLASTVLAPYAHAAEPVPIPLKIDQVLQNDGSATAPEATFTYHLTAQSPATPLPEGSGTNSYDFTITGDSQGSIDPIDFTRPGIYTYELRCDPAVEAGYVADTQVYTIEIYVTSDLRIFAVVTSSDGEKTSSIRFTQRYSARASDPAVMIDPPVEKIVKGNPSQRSTFTFQLKAEDPSNPMPAGSKNGVKTLSILGSGHGEFGVWSFTKEGVYHYTISEVDTGIKGYTYDTVIYKITDVVKAKDGQLVVERTLTDTIGTRPDACTFTNHYSASGRLPIVGGVLPKTGDMLKLAPYAILVILAALLLRAFLGRSTSAKKARV